MRFLYALFLLGGVALSLADVKSDQITVSTIPPTCADTAGQHLNWFANSFSCGTSLPTGMVTETGVITPGHGTMWSADGVVQDSGAAPVTISGSPTAGHVAMFNSTANQIQDAGITVPLSGTTGSIGGSLLSVGASASGTASIPGAVAGKNCIATASDGTNIYALGANIGCTVATAGVATVSVVAVIALTPPAKTYNVTVLP
jgi:hypothetical protein